MVTRSTEIEQVIREWYRRIEAGDMVAAANNVLSRDDSFRALGTDHDEWFALRDHLIEAYGRAAALGPPQITLQRLEAFCEGSIGWAEDQVELTRPGRASIIMRHTFVLRKEEGQWKVVHAHYSLPAPDGSSPPARQ